MRGSGRQGSALVTTQQQIEMFWRRRDADDSAIEAFDDEDHAVVYHRPSGVTHLLNAPTIRLLTEVLVEPASFQEIAAAFRTDNESLDEAEFVGVLQDMLARLEHYGFVERFRGPSTT